MGVVRLDWREREREGGAMRKLDEAGRDHGRPLRGGEGGDLESWRREKEKRAGSIQARGISGGFREVGGRGVPGIP